MLWDILGGALGFAAVSLLAFSVWAFGGKWIRGELALYSAVAGVFVAVSGLFLGPLAGGLVRFYRSFVPAFLAYAVVWCAAWWGLGGRLGEWVGAVVGGVAFTVVCLMILGNPRVWFTAAVAFIALHAAGYFAGDWAYFYAKANPVALAEPLNLTKPQVFAAARLAWGLLYGLGFGAGLGYVYGISGEKV